MSAVAEPAISIRNLSKTYPSPFRRLRAFFRRPVKEPVEALRDVTFEVQSGEIFGLIGRSGPHRSADFDVHLHVAGSVKRSFYG